MPANSFLISAIARPGFNPLGQVLVQFMMVWHLKKGNPVRTVVPTKQVAINQILGG